MMRLTRKARTFLEAQYRALLKTAYIKGLASTAIFAVGVSGAVNTSAATLPEIVIDQETQHIVVQNENPYFANTIVLQNHKTDNSIKGSINQINPDPGVAVEGDLHIIGADTALSVGSLAAEEMDGVTLRVGGDLFMKDASALKLNGNSSLAYKEHPNTQALINGQMKVDNGTVELNSYFYWDSLLDVDGSLAFTNGSCLALGTEAAKLWPNLEEKYLSQNRVKSDKAISFNNSSLRMDATTNHGSYLIAPELSFTGSNVDVAPNGDKLALSAANTMTFSESNLNIGHDSSLFITNTTDAFSGKQNISPQLKVYGTDKVYFEDSFITLDGPNSELNIVAHDIGLDYNIVNVAQGSNMLLTVKEKDSSSSFSTWANRFTVNGSLTLGSGVFNFYQSDYNDFKGSGKVVIAPHAKVNYSFKNVHDFQPFGTLMTEVQGKLRVEDGQMPINPKLILAEGASLELDGINKTTAYTIPSFAHVSINGDRSEIRAVNRDFMMEPGAVFTLGSNLTSQILGNGPEQKLSFFGKGSFINVETTKSSLENKHLKKLLTYTNVNPSKGIILDVGSAKIPGFTSDAKSIQWSEYESLLKSNPDLSSFTNTRRQNMVIEYIPPHFDENDRNLNLIAGQLMVHNSTKFYVPDDSLLYLSPNKDAGIKYFIRDSWDGRIPLEKVYIGKRAHVIFAGNGAFDELYFKGHALDSDDESIFHLHALPNRTNMIVGDLVQQQLESGERPTLDILIDPGVSTDIKDIRNTRTVKNQGNLKVDYMHDVIELTSNGGSVTTDALFRVQNIKLLNGGQYDIFGWFDDKKEFYVKGGPFLTEKSIANVNIHFQDYFEFRNDGEVQKNDYEARTSCIYNKLTADYYIGANSIVIFGHPKGNHFAELKPWLKSYESSYASVNPLHFGSILYFKPNYDDHGCYSDGYILAGDSALILDAGLADPNFLYKIKKHQLSAQAPHSASFYLGENTAVVFDGHPMVYTGLTTDADHFDIFAAGGTIFITDDFRTRYTDGVYQIFCNYLYQDGKREGNTITTIYDGKGQRLSADDKGILVSSLNFSKQGYITNDKTINGLPCSSGKVQLKTNPTMVSSVMYEASYPLLQTVLKDYEFSQNGILRFTSFQGHGAELEKAARLAVFGGSLQTAQVASSAATKAIHSRLGLGVVDTDLKLASNSQGVNLWVEPLFRHHEASGFGVQGFDYGADIDLKGAMLGLDHQSEHVIFGVAAGIGDGDADGKENAGATKNDFDFYTVALYGSYNVDNLRLFGSVSYTAVDNDIDTESRFETLSTSVDSTVFSCAVTGQYDINLDGFHVVPHAGLNYSMIDIDDYVVSGRQDYTKLTSESADVFSVPLGVTLSTKVEGESWTLQPSVDLAVTANVGDDTFDSTASWMRTNSIKTDLQNDFIDDITYSVKAGVNAQMGAWNFSLNCDYITSDHTDEFGAQAAARFTF